MRSSVSIVCHCLLHIVALCWWKNEAYTYWYFIKTVFCQSKYSHVCDWWLPLSCNRHIWYDGLDQLVFKMKWRSRYTNIKNFVVVSCRPYMESITKLLDKNLSRLRCPWGEETLTLIQVGIVGPPFPFLLMSNNSWLFLLLCLIHGLFYLSFLQIWTFAN